MTKITLTTEDTWRLAENLGPGYTVHDDYSGRGMYGDTCLGISIDRGQPNALLIANAMVNAIDTGLDPAELLAELSDVDYASDDLGLGSIIYWPDITVGSAAE